jgi:hypothetical protein
MFEQYKSADASLLIRTDFADDGAWVELCSLVHEPTEDDFRACFECVNDPRLAGIEPAALAKQVWRDLLHSIVFVADTRALYDPEHPVLCVCTSDFAAFRVGPKDIWGPENNLRLANMDFADFVSAADADGVFRGF